MCITIRCKAIKDNSLYPFISFIFVLMSIHISLNSKFNEHNVLQNIFSSIGSMLSFIPFLIYLKKSRNSIYQSKATHKTTKSDSNTQSLKINYEYNDKYEEVTYINYSNFFYLSILDYLQSLSLFTFAHFFSSNINAFFWSIDIMFLYIFSKCFLGVSIYRHHIISLIIFVLFDIYLSYVIIFGPDFNYWQIVYIIINNILFSLKVVYAKKLMDYNFISHYKLCLIIGGITLIYGIITLIIETIIDEKLDISEKYREFIDNFLDFCNKIINEDSSVIIKEIIFIILYIISSGLSNIFLYLTLSNLSPFHVLLTKILLCIEYNITKVILELKVVSIINICIYILSVFVLFFFLEIIQLNFCNLNMDTKDQIQERSLDKTNTFISIKSINDSSSISNVSGENNTTSSYSNSREF